MVDGSRFECEFCQSVGLYDGSDGFFYCNICSRQATNVRDTAVDHMILTQESLRGMVRRHVVKPESVSKSQPLSDFWKNIMTQEDVDAEAGDAAAEVRRKYVMGIQLMIEMQVDGLVKKCNVCPVIVGMIEPVWIRFVASTKIFSDRWADDVMGSKSQLPGVMIWYRSLSKTIPLCYSLAMSFLVCHLAREPILPTDIIKWSLEGKLPYFAAFVEIGERIGIPSKTGPLSSSSMFRPIQAISAERLESLAASIAHSIGLELPPVNFYAIASRYLKQLSLPVDIILPHACRIYEWSMPPELWLSANEFRLPTRAFVLSILILSVRILYNIHGFGKWEMSLACATKRNNAAELSESCSSQSDVDDSAAEQSNMDAAHILVLLQSKYNELIDTSDHAKDLEAYLNHCKDVVFAGVELPSKDYEENKIMTDLWDFYQKKKDHKPSESCLLGAISPDKRPLDHPKSEPNKTKKPKDDNVQIILGPNESYKEREIRRMKSNMKENKFCYIPPRRRVKRHDYLHYTRKKGDGAYVYAAHADYYILLRSCARVAQLDVRSMHTAVLSFERRLDWLEKNIQHSLKRKPSFEACKLCSD